jgi:hypothetical protein
LTVFTQLLADLPRSKPANYDFILTLILNLFATDASLAATPDDGKAVWMWWLSMLFQFCRELPVKFLTGLFRSCVNRASR